MSLVMADDPVDADRWLYVHLDEVVGASSASAVDLIHEAGLVSHVSHYRGRSPNPDIPDPGRVRLFIGDDDKVRGAHWG